MLLIFEGNQHVELCRPTALKRFCKVFKNNATKKYSGYNAFHLTNTTTNDTGQLRSADSENGLIFGELALVFEIDAFFMKILLSVYAYFKKCCWLYVRKPQLAFQH